MKAVLCWRQATEDTIAGLPLNQETVVKEQPLDSGLRRNDSPATFAPFASLR
jgi:hypothetical protein